MKTTGYTIYHKLITYCLLFSLVFPLLAGVLLITPAYAANGLLNGGFMDLIKGLLSLFLFANFFDQDQEEDYYQSAAQEETTNKANKDDSTDENYQRIKITPKETELLARAVYSEARGEPFKGQVAVAAVVINRVLSNQFPNSVKEVVFQKTENSYAFSAVLDGQIYMFPDQTAYEAVDYALNGWDPSNGAVYYYNPITATSSWIFENTAPITEIGNHVFAELNR